LNLRLPQDAGEQAWVHDIAWLAWYRDSPFFHRVMKLTVAALRADLLLAISFNQLDDLSDCHSLGHSPVSSCT
jgi:hypothetical protein